MKYKKGLDRENRINLKIKLSGIFKIESIIWLICDV